MNPPIPPSRQRHFGPGATLRFLVLAALASLACLWPALCALPPDSRADSDPIPPRPPVSRVDPFIGTGGHGHTFPGATLPFGMVQLSPDTRLEGWDGCSGYHYSDDRIFGFSHTHLSGTGVSDYGDVLLFPSTGPVKWHSGWSDPDGYGSHFSKSAEMASPGYYAVTLEDSGVRVELTATLRTGVHRYLFPPGGGDTSHVLLDLTHRDQVLDSGLRAVSPTEIEGFRISKAWAQDQRIYFVARFSQPMSSVQTEDGTELLRTGTGSEAETGRGAANPMRVGTNIVVALFFPMSGYETLLVKVGISAVSIENARENLDVEVPGWSFDAVHGAAWKTWDEALSRIEIEGGTDDEQTMFYTALYHALLQPNLFTDINGEYRGHDGKTHRVAESEGSVEVPDRTTSRIDPSGGAAANGGTAPPPSPANAHLQYTVFSLWDTFRAAHPLYTILEPARTEDFVVSMLRVYDQGGLLPVWELAGNETMCMIGYHSASVIADAYAKGIRGFDAEAALEAMKSSAMQDHLGLEEYRRYGYIPGDRESESVSKTLEYAYDDWCIARIAGALGHADDEEEYLHRAQSWRNILDPGTGFMRPKSDSRWKTPFLPTDVDFHFTEANSWQYSFFVPQDVSGLITALGGEDAFVARLDSLFSASSETTGRSQADITGLIGQYAHGNEPSHHVAYLYTFAGQPWKTQGRVHEILTTLYAAAPDGLAGNEDCGQMSAWFVLSSLGFYSVTPGQDTYVIGTPLFERATIHMENEESFTIVGDRADSGTSPAVRTAAPYIQSASLNGQTFARGFLTHDEILAGGELRFVLGSEPNFAWGVGPGNTPVSRIDDDSYLPVPYVAAGTGTFRDHVDVQLAGTATIYFTLDGSDPTLSSPRYETPLRFEETTHIRFVATDDENPPPRRLVQESTFRKIDGNQQIVSTTTPSPTYPGGSREALIDGLRGGPDFRLGTWQGFEGQDMEAVVDLGATIPLHRLAIGCLQDENSWIFMPASVEFEVSPDGEEFTLIGSATSGVDPRVPGAVLREIEIHPDGRLARFVRIRAHSLQVCPDWHKGAGNPCWIFVDEIIAE